MLHRLIFLHEKCCRMHRKCTSYVPWKEKHRAFRIICLWSWAGVLVEETPK
ncbi:unnamed protein product [Musa acuminata subsp. malaccensis]|uniref:(wild Malaysian banana) hypothetical protein n=1 Tax=Musa acuminata subsp. malaccensis TaxID=214687 RepID=A0A804J6L3_MUSAM|nr:unnamed protein product [Musa acuminata subsp. malaccensis]